MSKAIIAIILVFLLIGAGITFAYFKIESKDEEIQNTQVEYAIYAQNQDKDFVSTGYIIESFGSVMRNSTTLRGGAVLDKLPFNRSFVIYNYNLENQNYYIDEIKIDSRDNNTHRVGIDLIEAGTLDIITDGEVAEDDEIILTLSASGEIRNIHFCLKWSPYILSVKSDFILVEEDLFKDGYSKCYFTNETMENNEKLLIPLQIKRLGDLLRDDYVEVLVYDADYLNGGYITDSIGMEDYQIKVINNIYK